MGNFSNRSAVQVTRRLLGLCLAASIGVLGSGGASAAAADPNVNVVVTWSRAALPTYLAYKVDIKNGATNDLNRVSFTGTATVVDGSNTSPALIDSVIAVDGVGCVPPTVTTPTISENIVTCKIGLLGQLIPGASTSFVVVVKAPTSGAALEFSWTFTGKEGNSLTGNGCCDTTGLNKTALVATVDVQAKSFLKLTSDSRTFTGNGSFSTATNQFLTSVNVPASSSYTTAEIVESTGEFACNNFTTCWRSTITIPPPANQTSFSPYLTFTLSQDKANIKRGTKIESVTIQYHHEGKLDYTVDLCIGAFTATPQINPNGPCIANRVYYKNSSVPGWSADLDGDMVWTLINPNNGSFDLF